MFPAGGPWHNILPGNDWHSALSMALPFMEQQAVYDMMNFRIDPTAGQNTTASFYYVNSFQCPSDNTLRMFNQPWAPTSYRVNISRVPAVIGSWHALNAGAGPYPGGIFEYVLADWPAAKLIRLADILDGTTNTAIASESLKGYGHVNGGLVNKPPHRAHIFKGGSSVTSGWWASNEGITRCLASPTLATWGHAGNSGLFYSRGLAEYTMYTHAATPNQKNCGTLSVDGNEGEWEVGIEINAMSNHTGGVNMAFVDGTVRFIGDNVSLDVYRALGGRDDGQSTGGL